MNTNEFDEEGEEIPIQVKVVILGEQFVGKTSLCRQFVSQTFEPNCESTVRFKKKNQKIKNKKKKICLFNKKHPKKIIIRIAFQSKNINLNGEKVTLRIWDTVNFEYFFFFLVKIKKINKQKKQIHLLDDRLGKKK